MIIHHIRHGTGHTNCGINVHTNKDIRVSAFWGNTSCPKCLGKRPRPKPGKVKK